MFRALAVPHRRQILALVRDQDRSAGAIADEFHISRPAVSQHLSVLKQAGLIVERREGTKRLYRANPRALVALRAFVEDLWAERLEGLRREAEAEAHAPSDERISVEREVIIHAPPSAVWRWITEPKKATRWMGKTARIDPSVGGRYRVEVLPERFASGEILELDAPRRFVHTWGWELDASQVPPGSTIVSYDLFERGEGTRLRLCHRDLPSVDTAGSHARGWAHYVPRLAVSASGGDPGPDPWARDEATMERELRPASAGPRKRVKKGKSR